jgi:hypothetical protein
MQSCVLYIRLILWILTVAATLTACSRQEPISDWDAPIQLLAVKPTQQEDAFSILVSLCREAKAANPNSARLQELLSSVAASVQFGGRANSYSLPGRDEPDTSKLEGDGTSLEYSDLIEAVQAISSIGKGFIEESKAEEAERIGRELLSLGRHLCGHGNCRHRFVGILQLGIYGTGLQLIKLAAQQRGEEHLERSVDEARELVRQRGTQLREQRR